MMRDFLQTAALVLAVALISGCATIFSGTTQTIHVQAIDSTTNQLLPGATCTLTDAKGITYAIPANPGSVLVSKGAGGINPLCRKEDYIQKNFGVGDSFNAVTLVNVLFWPGFIVDAVSGSMHRYPSHISVMMEPVKH